MTLYGSIQLGANTLRAMQIGMHVAGNNIANANTPGFIREEVIYTPAPALQIGRLQLGLGVQIEGIVQKLDRFVQDRLVGARGDRAGAEVQEKAYQDLELVVGELSDTDLSTSLSSFFNSIDAVLENPGDASLRNLTVLKGQALARDFNRLSSRVDNLRVALNKRVPDLADEVNDLVSEMRTLNIRITSAEGGGGGGSDAGGLRSQRQVAVDRLSQLVNIEVNEQPSGGLAVSVGGEFIVFEGQSRAVESVLSSVDGFSAATVQFVDNQSPLQVESGELQGIYTARDDILGGFLTELDDLAAILAGEFNKLHSQGQGLVGFQEVTALEGVADTTIALDAAGLAFAPINGNFDLLVRNTNTGLTDTTSIRVDLNGLDEDTSLDDLAAALDAVDGVAASISATGVLTIASDAQDTEIAFAGDTSGILAALGINTFFTGTSARDLGVHDQLSDERLFAASAGGIDFDTRNAERMAVFLDESLDVASGNSLADLYSQMVQNVTQGSTIAQSVADGFRVFEGTLDGEHQAVSGVNLDEEAIRLIMLQRTFQAAARHIRTVSELLEVLVNL